MGTRERKARIVLELANGPVTPAADDGLAQKRMVVIPDVWPMLEA